MKKIKIILSLMFFLTPTVCFAKEIKIDNINYNVEDILELPGLKYNAKDDSIILNNANLISIQSNNDLNIILNGNNSINNNSSILSCIEGKHVTIEGSGTLNLIGNKSGITAKVLDINNTTLYGDVFTSMFILNGDNSSVNINNSNVIFKDNETAFYIVDGGVNINESNVIIKRTINLGSDTIKYINLNNSNLDIVESDNLFTNLGVINIDSSSKVFINCKNGIDLKYFNGKNIKFFGSIDNNLYHENINIEDKYLKTIYDNSLEQELEYQKEELTKRIDEVLNKESELNYEKNKLNEEEKLIEKKEENNKYKEKELNNKELELLELDKELSKKEEELVTKENNITTSLNSLDVKEDSIRILENILTGKQNHVTSVETSLEKEKQEIESLKNYLNLKEKDLLDKENQLRLEQNKNLGVEEDKNLYGKEGGIDDDLLESNMEFNQTNSNSIDKLGNFFYLIISYISGIVTHIFTKRRING